MKVTIDIPEGCEIKVVPPVRRPPCSVCGGSYRVKVFGAWLLGVDTALCFPCFSEWFDGETDTARIREQSLAKQASNPMGCRR